MKIGFVGMGKLGFPCALAAADKGHDVMGYDVGEQAYEILASRKYPHREVGAQGLLEETTLRMTESLAELVKHADIVLLAVQTPHQPEFEGLDRMPEHRADFSYGALKAAVSDVARFAAVLNKPTVIDIISTCLPGTYEREIKPLVAGNQWVSVAYTPYFIAMGTTIIDFLKPEFVLIGRGDEWATEHVREFYRSISNAPHRVMSITSAELTKVYYNVFLGLKIIAANAGMEIAHKTGANIDDVTDALALATDRVVSPKYMRAGMGDGGGCFTKGQEILAERGWVAINEVQVGERVRGGDGELHEVLETYRRPWKGEVVVFEGGFGSFTVTPDHPIFIARDRENFGVELPDLVETPASLVELGDVLYLPDNDPRLRAITGRATSGWSRCITAKKWEKYEGTVYNLNVDGVHNYVCRGGLVANCHPRDQIALSWLAQKLDLSFDLYGAMVKAREQQTEWLAYIALEEALKADIKHVIVLGKAYKRGTNLTLGSPAILLKNILDEFVDNQQWSGEILQWDPHVDESTVKSGFFATREVDGVFEPVPAVYVVATDHDEFFVPTFNFPAGSVVVDPWGKFVDRADIKVIRLGRTR